MNQCCLTSALVMAYNTCGCIKLGLEIISQLRCTLSTPLRSPKFTGALLEFSRELVHLLPSSHEILGSICICVRAERLGPSFSARGNPVWEWVEYDGNPLAFYKTGELVLPDQDSSDQEEEVGAGTDLTMAGGGDGDDGASGRGGAAKGRKRRRPGDGEKPGGGRQKKESAGGSGGKSDKVRAPLCAQRESTM